MAAGAKQQITLEEAARRCREHPLKAEMRNFGGEASCIWEQYPTLLPLGAHCAHGVPVRCCICGAYENPLLAAVHAATLQAEEK